MHLLRALLFACLPLCLHAGETRPAPRVLLAPYSGVITPVAAEFLTAAISRADAGGYEALIIQLDTPGGLDLSMREIIKGIFASKVPVIVYVHPPGTRAASAGVFITMAAHVAAMSPGTNIGAAHPVSLPAGVGKADTDKTMETKAVSDAAAYLRSIAQKRGRNETWAYEAVSKSTSIPAAEALKIGVIDVIAADVPELLRAADGRMVADLKRPLKTAGAEVERFEMTRRQRWLAAIVDPNVAVILMSLGAAGMFIELYNPGLILPGVVGAISLLLAFYSFQTLSASYAGVSLLLVGLVFFLLEIKVTSYGMLALGGVAAIGLGSLMLFQGQPLGGLGVSLEVLGGMIAGLLAVVAAASWVVYRAYRRAPATGVEGMIGAEGKALSDIRPTGIVSVGGEIWDADSASGPVAAGDTVEVLSVEGLRLKIRKK